MADALAPTKIEKKALVPFYDLYFSYVGYTEVPMIFNRWSPIAIIGAMLGRQCWLKHGHWTIYPNQYILFVGDPASRKTTSIDIASAALRRTGYNKFSADKSSMQRFLVDLLGERAKVDPDKKIEDYLEDIIDFEIPSERLIAADELVDFMGMQNLDFLVMLSRLWDAKDKYEHPKIHGESIVVPKPTVSMLAGSQPSMLYKAFPPEAIGQGVMSRIIMVYAEPTGVKITFPLSPTDKNIKAVNDRLLKIKKEIEGEFIFTKIAQELTRAIYEAPVLMTDFRFKHYNNRRLTHLFKAAMILAAMDCRMTIEGIDIIRANTLLHCAERRMPRALGEFGKSRLSEISDKAMRIMLDAGRPMTAGTLFKLMSNDVDSMEQLKDVLDNMRLADKIQITKHNTKSGQKSGYSPRIEVRDEWDSQLVDKEFLTMEEWG